MRIVFKYNFSHEKYGTCFLRRNNLNNFKYDLSNRCYLNEDFKIIFATKNLSVLNMHQRTCICRVSRENLHKLNAYVYAT